MAENILTNKNNIKKVYQAPRIKSIEIDNEELLAGSPLEIHQLKVDSSSMLSNDTTSTSMWGK